MCLCENIIMNNCIDMELHLLENKYSLIDWLYEKLTVAKSR